MYIITREFVKDKKVLLRLDIDVPIKNKKVADDFRLKAGLATIKLCLKHAEDITILGHIGRPEGKEVPGLSVAPIYEWLEENLGAEVLENGKLKLLENLRFESGEEDCSLTYAKSLAKLGDCYVNEAFAAFHPAASTTVLPTLIPHCAGLHFAQEVQFLTKILKNPKKPLVAIIGGVKVEDKLPVALSLAKIADTVLLGGKIVSELCKHLQPLPANIVVGQLKKSGEDITENTVEAWVPIISRAKMVVWNGPLGLVEDARNNESRKIAQAILKSQAESIIGGGDTVSYLNKIGFLNKFTCLTAVRGRAFVSCGGGAMLKFLTEGTLPTIKALEWKN